MQSALRWLSLLGTAAVLYGAGARRLHLHDFSAFLALVVILSLVIVAVFRATRRSGRHPS